MTIYSTTDNFDKKLKYLLWVVVLLPIFFGQLFNLAQVFGQVTSDYMCVFDSKDYLTYLAIEGGRNNLSIYMPFAGWNMLNVLLSQFVASIILIYEIYVIIANRKGNNSKKSLIKRFKKPIFSFFFIILAIYAVSDIYMAVKRPMAQQQAEYLNKITLGHQDVFMVCSQANRIEIGDKTQIIPLNENK